MQNKLLVIIGPTSVGKSALAVFLAKRFGGEIISADSRQVYKGLNVGTAKITKKEMQSVKHHLLDIADPKKHFDIIQYTKKARKTIRNIINKNKLPIVVGGTGFYIQALLDRINIPNIKPNHKLRKKLSTKSVYQLFAILKKLNLEKALSLNNSDRHNPHRLIRAIEIAEATSAGGNSLPRSVSERGRAVSPERMWLKTSDFLFIGLTLPKDELRKRINDRLQKDLKKGLMTETRKLHEKGLSWKRFDELGLQYRYASLYLQGKINKEELKTKLQNELWHYAKRQMTWFKRDKKIVWFEPSHKKGILKSVYRFIS